MATPSVVNVTHLVNTGNVASAAFTKPAGLSIGDLLVIFACNGGTLAFNTPAGFTLIDNISAGAIGAALYAFYRIVDGTEGASFTLSVSGGSNEIYGGVYGITGIAGTPIEAHATASDTSGNTAPTCPSVTLSGNNRLVLFCESGFSLASITAPAGSTKRWDDKVTSKNMRDAAADIIKNSGATGTFVWGSTLNGHIAMTVAIKGQNNVAVSTSDNAPASDLSSAHSLQNRATADVAVITDASARATIAARPIADTAAASDSANPAAHLFRLTADIAQAIDSAMIQQNVQRGALDLAPAADSPAYRLVAARGIADTAAAIDAPPVRSVIASRSDSDTAAATDANMRAVRSTRSTSDPAFATDAPSRTLGITRATFDNALAVDALASHSMSMRTASESAPAADAPARSVINMRGIVDSAPAIDLLATTSGSHLMRTLMDTAPASDGPARQSAISRATNDSAPAADVPGVVAMTTVRNITDTAHASDGLSTHQNLNRSNLESAPAIDNAAMAGAYVRSIVDSAFAIDAPILNKSIVRLVLDFAPATDSDTWTRSSYGTGRADGIGGAYAFSQSMQPMAIATCFGPGALFTQGEMGGWYDLSDFTSLFQDTFSLVPAVINGPLGCIQDKRLNPGTRRNLLSSSEDYSGLDWVTSSIVMTPNGNATHIVDVPSAPMRHSLVQNSICPGGFYSFQIEDVGNRVSISALLQAAESRYARLYISNILQITVDLVAGTIRPLSSGLLSVTASDWRGSITALGDGLFSVSSSCILGATDFGMNTDEGLRLVSADDPDGSSTYAGTGTNGVYVSGMQVELSMPTAYQKTLHGANGQWTPGNHLLASIPNRKGTLRGTPQGAEILTNWDFINTADPWILTPNAGTAAWDSSDGGQLDLADGGTADQVFATIPGKTYQVFVQARANDIGVQVGTEQGDSDLLALSTIPARSVAPIYDSNRYFWFTATDNKAWVRLSRSASGIGTCSITSIKAADAGDVAAPYWGETDGISNIWQSAPIDLGAYDIASASIAYRVNWVTKGQELFFLGTNDVENGIAGLPTCLEIGQLASITNDAANEAGVVSQFRNGMGFDVQQLSAFSAPNTDVVLTGETNVTGAGQNNNPSNCAIWLDDVVPPIEALSNDPQSGVFGPNRVVSVGSILLNGAPFSALTGSIRFYGAAWLTRQLSDNERANIVHCLAAKQGRNL